jgi:hypothetical protein
MKKYKLLALGAIVALVGLFALPVAAGASSGGMRSGTTATVGGDEVLDSTAYLAGSTVRVSGTIHGDLYCAGQNIDITGTIDGDVICAGQTVTVAGKVSGNVRVAGQTVTVTGYIARNLTVFGQSVVLTDSTNVSGDATVFGSSLRLGGFIGRDAVLGGQTVTVLGSVGRNVTVSVEDLVVAGNARVGGSLDYTSRNTLQKDTTAVIAGQTQRHDPPTHQEDRAVNVWAAAAWGSLFWLGCTLVLGLILLGLAPRTFRASADILTKQAGWALVSGFAALILTPIVAITLMITVLGVAAGFALLLVWGAALIVSYSYVSFALGEWIAAKAGWKLKWHGVTSLVLGAIVLALLMLIPILGGLVGFLALSWGLGSQAMVVSASIRGRSKTAKS